MKYKLIVERSIEELNDKVEAYLSQGYTLYYAPFYCPESSTTKEAFAQAVVKYPNLPPICFVR